MYDYDYKKITDPIHGTITLSKLEADIIGTPAFQRLRNISQLGLVNLVFPGANYSRFSHSIGVCHVVGAIMASLQKRYAKAKEGTPDFVKKITDEDVRDFRLAGLLHDIGHYPFSHTMDQAVREALGKKNAENYLGEDAESSGNASRALRHEDVGRVILKHDPDLTALFTKEGIDPERVASIFTGTCTDKLKNVLSSDLDADRIDYLKRSAHYTGLPYGTVDLAYILNQIRLDEDRQLCFDPKALHTAEHLLIGRFFDYQQVIFHKAVASLEWLLEDVLKYLLETGVLQGREDQIIAKLTAETKDWVYYDDAHVYEKIRELSKERSLIASKARAIILRNPPKLIAEIEYFAQREKDTQEQFVIYTQNLKRGMIQCAQKYNLDIELWNLWENKAILTEGGGNLSLTEACSTDGRFRKEEAKAVRICENEGVSHPIMNDRTSLMKALSNQALFKARVYLLRPQGFDEQKIEKIRTELKNEAGLSLPWKPC